jgi:hypothetical protein
MTRSGSTAGHLRRRPQRKGQVLGAPLANKQEGSTVQGIFFCKIRGFISNGGVLFMYKSKF